ncbi:3-oxoacyl-[acyl-carrier-protein] reductase FabG [Sporomusa silvacetica DSM 10669]|uniref:3-oxoacyl-[acyl-carrier-protein] reductase FabG n=1 Tax=Sporomusa silvacetica DSM 10669 TaxID=1123289 RepID=A0ABZ3IR78_9FIRM|nr:SDR family NAD(P)-dependent oxidoreductase [Sporomusa silvacetica]OZC20696.1 3-oxoacyl-[acyl-carrier-protein] reductase FabG [Sporomusa silvacetica DSM 10669]
MKTLQGKVAIIAGASRGVGRGVALGLAEQGATVYVVGRTEKDDELPQFLKGTTIYQAVDKVNELGGTGIAYKCDLRKDEEVEKFFKTVNREQGRLDILVNSAWPASDHIMKGYFSNTPFWEQPLSFFDDFIRVGVRSNYVASRLAAQMMTKQKSGLIVNISYFAGRRYWFNVANGVCKAAIDKLSADTAHELRQYGVTVISLYPDTVRTEGMIALAHQDKSIDLSDSESPQFVGRCVAALANDENIMNETGKILITAEVAQHYGFTDVDGRRPKSQREELW